jgi:mono/diheme cytochrome c family protein
MSQDPNIPESEEFREAELASDMNVAKVHGSIIREQADPRDGYEPISLWLITFSFALVFWAGMYLVSNSGGFSSEVFNTNLVAWDGSGAAVDKGPPDPMVVGKRVYTQYCVVCHQTTGLGVAGQFPPLAASEWVLSQDWHGDNHLAKIVLHGLQGPVVVKGNPYNNAMAPWGGVLKDDQIAAVLTYIRNEWGNSAPPITPEFVATVREQSADRKEAWTQKELQAVPRILIDSTAAPATEPAPAADPAAQPSTPAATGA